MTRNYRSRWGEIDLIMTEDDTLVFVEVRQRSGSGFGTAVESVDRRKQRRITATAASFLQSRPALAGRQARFDVVGIDGDGGIQWVRDAFRVEE